MAIQLGASYPDAAPAVLDTGQTNCRSMVEGAVRSARLDNTVEALIVDRLSWSVGQALKESGHPDATRGRTQEALSEWRTGGLSLPHPASNQSFTREESQYREPLGRLRYLLSSGSGPADRYAYNMFFLLATTEGVLRGDTTGLERLSRLAYLAHHTIPVHPQRYVDTEWTEPLESAVTILFTASAEQTLNAAVHTGIIQPLEGPARDNLRTQLSQNAEQAKQKVANATASWEQGSHAVPRSLGAWGQQREVDAFCERMKNEFSSRQH